MASLVPIRALLHPVAAVWGHFTVHWTMWFGLGGLWALYEWRARVHASRNPAEHPTGTQRALFLGGLLMMLLSLNGPLHDLSDSYLFSAHMVQHLLLTLWIPPLLIAGTPGWMLRPALRFGWVNWLARHTTTAPAAFIIFNLVIIIWHLPPIYNAAMANHNLHIVQHLIFLVSATLMWWPLMSPLPELPRLPYPGQMLYCFLMSIPMSIVAIYIALADHVLYPAYSAAPRVWGILPRADQQIGGLIMWVPGGLFFYLVMTIVFFRWSNADADHRAGAQVDWRPGTR